MLVYVYELYVYVMWCVTSPWIISQCPDKFTYSTHHIIVLWYTHIFGFVNAFADKLKTINLFITLIWAYNYLCIRLTFASREQTRHYVIQILNICLLGRYSLFIAYTISYVQTRSHKGHLCDDVWQNNTHTYTQLSPNTYPIDSLKLGVVLCT
jgi:hypothetical protein